MVSTQVASMAGEASGLASERLLADEEAASMAVDLNANDFSGLVPEQVLADEQILVALGPEQPTGGNALLTT